MPDMLVKLYDMPATVPGLAELEAKGIRIKRALPQDKFAIVQYVQETFGKRWAGECDVCFSNKPVSTFVAQSGREVIGFACYDSTCLDFFGPVGVSEQWRSCGVGKALVYSCLLSMRDIGYAYAIIGGVGDALEYYRRHFGALPIEGSFPGVYARAIGSEEVGERRHSQD